MFSLIITIISIALVTALALATIYYGGSAFRQGGDAASAAKLINEGQQLSGAAAIVEANTGTDPALTQTGMVTANALQSQISSWGNAAVARAFSTSAVITPAVCAKVNEKTGLKAVDTVAAADTDTALVVAAGDIKNYGCITATNVVNFKY